VLNFTDLLKHIFMGIQCLAPVLRLDFTANVTGKLQVSFHFSCHLAGYFMVLGFIAGI